MERLFTPNDVERRARAIGFPVALHTEQMGSVACDRYYVHKGQCLAAQTLRALAAAQKHGTGILVLPYPNNRRLIPDP